MSYTVLQLLDFCLNPYFSFKRPKLAMISNQNIYKIMCQINLCFAIADFKVIFPQSIKLLR